MSVRILSAILLLCSLGLVACGGSGSGERITVLGSWTGEEGEAFREMLSGFEKDTGIDVEYTGTRDARAVLASELHDGHPPDAAVLATPGDLRAYAASGELRPLPGGARGIGGDLASATGPDGRRHSYGIVVKASVKSLIWYNPRNLPSGLRERLTAPGLTWDELSEIAGQAGSRPWCLGLADTSVSGWPGTDWIEDLLLHESGPEVYDEWVSGRLAWTSDPVRSAWRAFGAVVAASHGDARTALLTGYGQAGAPMFATPPGCRFDHAGSFITAFYRRAPGRPEAGRDYDHIPFPGAGSVVIGGDVLGVFRDTPAVRRLVAHLATAGAQRTWTGRPGSGAFSLNREVRPDDYPDALSRRIAQTLAGARTVRFDASDTMPTVMGAAFNHAVLEYVADPEEDRLDGILDSLDRVRRTTRFPS
ncbi:carbohydrate ABC transporter substrate-binding protein [Actinomadura sp. GC306]|uniref:ABC transporter substrate-binding protein n=1 Tax=Actinomadura sp. GC306 TaxID=2530367 RepID=UPI0010448806|nr:ABC transporter substrate-binding protein [Actinomadura sp. GC306]TDC69241.1 carbohydrate ABC transporter substrate-binding protein [Actinomadura sp. GC306]